MIVFLFIPLLAFSSPKCEDIFIRIEEEDKIIKGVSLSKTEKAILYEYLLREPPRRLGEIGSRQGEKLSTMWQKKERLIKKLRAFFSSMGIKEE